MASSTPSDSTPTRTSQQQLALEMDALDACHLMRVTIRIVERLGWFDLRDHLIVLHGEATERRRELMDAADC